MIFRGRSTIVAAISQTCGKDYLSLPRETIPVPVAEVETRGRDLRIFLLDKALR